MCHAIQYIFVTYFILNSLYLLLFYTHIDPLLLHIPTGYHEFVLYEFDSFFVLFICKSLLL